ncbi:MAG: N-acetylmuramoyl-L-alanine amidase, partial [Actinomycetota bacterium]|nr:N-acetylmuramoyl-L-alanine amidase [Actinomycetota bacterium]
TALRRAAALIGAGSAGAQDPQPEIAPRSAWEGGQCQPRSAPAYREVKVAFVHHTVNANDYTAEQVPAMILGMCRYHRNSRGWNDLGYNFVADRFGRLWEGRAGGVDKAVVGAHTTGMNSQSFSVSNLGTYSEVPVSEEALQAMTRLIRWKLPLHGQPTSGQVAVVSNGGSGSHFEPGEEATLERVSGHRDANSTSCPGQVLYDQLPQLRERVAGAPVAPREPATVTLERPPKRLAKGTNQKMRGTVSPAKQSVSILIEKKQRGRWVRWFGRSVPARPDGTFLKKVRFRHEGLYRATALFGGDGTNAPGRSRTFHVRVPRKPPSGSSYSDPKGGGAAAR